MPAAAQREIRAYAEVVGREIVARWVPFVWSAFEDYVLDATVLSAPERHLLAVLARGGDAVAEAAGLGFVRREADGSLKVLREGAEFAEKLPALGFAPPW